MAEGGRGFDIVGGVGGLERIRPVDVPTALPQRDLHSVRPPHVRGGAERIEWTIWPGGWVPGAPSSECLFNFMTLAYESDVAEFVRFAQRHGVLGIGANPGAVPGGSPGARPPKDVSMEVPGDSDWNCEPLDKWRSYAKHAKMILVLAMALRGDERIDPVTVLKDAGFGPEVYSFGVRTEPDQGDITWYELHYPLPDPVGSWPLPADVARLPREQHVSHERSDPVMHLVSMVWVKTLAQQRQVLAEWVKEVWLDQANIRPKVEWSSGPASLELSLDDRMWGVFLPKNTLFDVLAAEIVGIICSDRYVGRCSRCAALHQSKIKVRTDQPNYCDSCRLAVRRATNRDAARRRYARQKTANAVNVDTPIDTLAGGQPKTK